LLSDDVKWRDEALCAQVDPELFFEKNANAAKRVCASCRVAPQCLNEALEDEIPYGVWGGVAAHQRRDMLREIRGAEYEFPTLSDRWANRDKCGNGHKLTEDNILLVAATGGRRCLTCKRERDQEWQERRKRERRAKRMVA
jgi:hypothetical protein